MTFCPLTTRETPPARRETDRSRDSERSRSPHFVDGGNAPPPRETGLDTGISEQRFTAITPTTRTRDIARSNPIQDATLRPKANRPNTNPPSVGHADHHRKRFLRGDAQRAAARVPPTAGLFFSAHTPEPPPRPPGPGFLALNRLRGFARARSSYFLWPGGYRPIGRRGAAASSRRPSPLASSAAPLRVPR